MIYKLSKSNVNERRAHEWVYRGERFVDEYLKEHLFHNQLTKFCTYQLVPADQKQKKKLVPKKGKSTIVLSWLYNALYSSGILYLNNMYGIWSNLI